MKYNVKVTEYNNEIQLSVYSAYIHRTDEEVKNEISEHHVVDSEQYLTFDEQSIEARIKASEVRSKRRSKQNIYNICRANEWDYFATFTFSKNRYDYEECKKKLQYFLNNFSKRKAHLEYLVIPEQHADGAWHFHALIKADLSKYLVPGWRPGCYQLKEFTHGINEIEPVRDTQRVSMYITKYITKELQDTLKNKHRYFYTRGLKKGSESFFEVDNLNLIDFVQANFPEYNFSYSTECSFGDGNVKYIQLKKEGVNDQRVVC